MLNSGELLIFGITVFIITVFIIGQQKRKS
jgi:hypothetical protein